MTAAPALVDPAGAATRWAVWALASAGKFFEGMVVFLGAFTLPVVAEQFELGGLQQGALRAASLVGILVGAVVLGALADRLGRRPLFIAAMGLLVFGLALVVLAPDPLWVGVGLLLIGLALGADYPVAHLVIAECMPVAIRGRMVLSAFGFQAVGVLLGTALAALLLPQGHEPVSWRLLYLLPLPAVVLVLLGRLLLPRHSPWLLGRADLQLARLSLSPGAGSGASGWLLLQPPLRRATALACLPWFLQDLATYGIGLSLPLLLAAANAADWPALGASVLIDLMLVLGISAAIALADRWGRIPLQITGFIGCAAGLALAGLALGPMAPGLPLLVLGLALFQFMTNLGPNAQTYLLAGELFPTPLRGVGAGLAAAAGKGGAVLTALVCPLVLQQQGAGLLLALLACTSVLGAAITWWFRQETRDRDLLA
ncbi:MAG: hypothetical protein RLZZ516_977 [Cyanobacteriota bacterium]|jgi:MFS family permease